MNWKISALLFTILAISVSPLYGQKGDLWISNHTPNDSKLQVASFDLTFTKEGILTSASQYGILQYDGKYWDHYPTPGAALSVAVDSLSTVYVGCIGDFGKISYRRGKRQFTSLHPFPGEKSTTFSQVLQFKNKLYFLSQSQLFEYTPGLDKARLLMKDSLDTGFESAFIVNNSFFIQSSSRVLDMTGTVANVDYLPKDRGKVLFTTYHSSKGRYLMGMEDNMLYVVEEGRLTVENDFAEIAIEDAQWVNDSVYVVSTQDNGIQLFVYNSHEVLEHVNNLKGLPDNEIRAICTDNNNGVWVAHEFGFSRISPSLPIRNYANYPGLEGEILAVNFVKDTLYVSTSRGGFFLKKESSYKTVAYYEKKIDTPSKAKTIAPKKATENSGRKKKSKQKKSKKRAKKEPKSKVGINLKRFSRAAKNTLSNVGDKVSEVATSLADKTVSQAKRIKSKIRLSNNGKQIVGKPKPNEYVRRTRQELVSEKLFYEPIQGLAVKSQEIISFNSKVLAVTKTGVYEIENGQATLVIDEPVRTYQLLESQNQLVMSTYNDQILVYEEVSDVWALVNVLPVREPVLSFYLQDRATLWMAGTNNLLAIDTSFAVEVKRYPMSNMYFDEVSMGNISDTLCLISKQGYFYFDPGKDSVQELEPFEQLIGGKPQKHLKSPLGIFWVFNGEAWVSIDASKKVTTYHYLTMFPDLGYIREHQSKLWMVKNGEAILEYNQANTDSLANISRVFIKSVKSRKGLLSQATSIELAHNNNTLIVNLSRPDYLGLLNVEYQYRLVGLSDTWSNWSNDDQLEFNYLPPGSYQLLVRSRDAFGRVQETKKFDFTITPPYWETTWFYAAQVIFFIILVVVSAQMNRRQRLGSTLVTNGLTLLTLVFIIELLQNVAMGWFGTVSSPVVEFAIDVFTALMIFPIEVVLRKYMKAELRLSQAKDLLKKDKEPTEEQVI